MDIEFRHGPKDGERRFLPLGQLSQTILVTIERSNNVSIDYLYKRTDRVTYDGYTVYQCLGRTSELLAA